MSGGGLARLGSDGNWTVFDTDNSGLQNNGVKSLLSDGQGGVWVGTSGDGLVRLGSDGSWTVFDTSGYGLPDNYVESLISDGQGGVWVGTRGGLARLGSDGSWTVFDKSGSDLPNNWVKSLLSDGQGGVWVGTSGGLARLGSDGNWTVFKTSSFGLLSKHVSSLLSDGQGGVWVGTPGDGLARLGSDGNWTVFDTSGSGLPDNYVESLLSDGQGGVWVGTWGGLARLGSDGNWTVFDTSGSGLPSNIVLSLLSDGQGGVWVGTQGGLARLGNGVNWTVFDMDNSGLPNNDVKSLLSDGQGGVWVGTGASGLARLGSGGNWTVFDTDNSGLPSNFVESLLSDGQGGVWVGTWGGLARLGSDGKWTVFDTSGSGLPDNYVLSLLSDGQRGVWVGTQGGLARLGSDGNWTVFNTDNSGLPDNSVYSLLSDGQGGVWVGTRYGGLARRLGSDGNWTVFDTSGSGLPSNFVFSLLSDGQRGVWVGTSYGGLARLGSDGNWTVFNTDNSGLPDNWVYSLLSDGQGGIWVGTQGGLAHFLQLGTPEQTIKPNSPEITINWFLNSSSLDYQNVKYIELQRSLSQDGVYETVLDASDKLIRFYADYSICPKPRVDNCWVTVEGHTPETRTNSDGSTTKGYRLNTPINDPEWLEGLPRYYRLSAVIEEDGKLVRVANNSEAALITPQVEEKPRVELTLDRNAIAMNSNTKAEITVFVSSLDLFRGDVALEIESATGNPISNNINAELEPAAVSLKAGETKPVLLTIEAVAENTQNIKIIPKIQSGYSGKSTSLNVQVGDGTAPMIALSIAHKTKRTRVLDSLTISGNVIPAQAGQKVVVSGNNIKESAESAISNESLTLTTDENGYFQGSVTPIHAGLLTLTAQSNGITSNNAEIFILSARTNIALSSNVNQSTKKGDILRVQGIITPVRLDGTKVNLDIRYLDPADSKGQLKPQFVGGVEIDADGIFYRDVVVPGNGFINVKASLPETSDYLSINTKLVIPIGQPVGEGIILVSESGDAEFQNIWDCKYFRERAGL